jgi:hypothetical protein
MLQLTPRYLPWLPPTALAAVYAALVAGTVGYARLDGGAWSKAVLGLGLLAAAVFATATLWLQAHRRRTRADIGLAYHRLAMAALLLLFGGWGLEVLGAPGATAAPASIIAAVLALVGVFVSVISGMLYKIVPFTAWLSLCRTHGVRQTPGMAHLLPESWARGQLRLHCLSLAALLLAPLTPSLARAAGLLFAGSSAWLGVNLARCAWVTWRTARQAPVPALDPRAATGGCR